MSRGIDYSGRQGAIDNVNRDPETGIRFGIISQHALSGEAIEDFEDVYVARCPHCGEEIPDDTHFENKKQRRPGGAIVNVYAADCPSCGKLIREEEQYGDEPDARVVDDGAYKAHIDSDGDVWFEKSPFYTHAAFCSPCAPGACHLNSPCDDGERTFCPGHDWFEDGAPFPIYKVENDERVINTAEPAFKPLKPEHW